MLNDNDGKPQGNMLRYIDGIFIEKNDQTNNSNNCIAWKAFLMPILYEKLL